MITIIAIPITLIAILSSIWFDYSGWFFLLLLSIIAQISIVVLKSENSQFDINESDYLTIEASEMLKKHRHIFIYPMTCKQLAGVLGLNQFVGILFVILNIYNEIYWTLLLAIINWYSLAYAAYFFNPLIWFANSNQLHTYDEIVDYIQNR